MNRDAYAIDLGEIEQDTEDHLSLQDAARLGLEADVESADEVDVEWLVR